MYWCVYHAVVFGWCSAVEGHGTLLQRQISLRGRGHFLGLECYTPAEGGRRREGKGGVGGRGDGGIGKREEGLRGEGGEGLEEGGREGSSVGRLPLFIVVHTTPLICGQDCLHHFTCVNDP